jgi:uncharacterized protein
VTEPYGELRPDGDRCAVRFERLFAFTPEEVWATLTDSAQLRGWLAEVPKFEAEVGGGVAIDFGEGNEVRGEVLAVEPLRLLEYTWTFPGETESVVRFELRSHARGTLLVLDHRALGRDLGAGYAAGWHAHLDRLADRTTEWLRRYEELLPSYREQGARLGWDRAATSPVREALYRGDRAAAEAAAAGGEVDVFDAAALGRLGRLRELLEADAELAHTLSDDGFTPLHLACFSGGAEAARLLVEGGAPLERLSEASFARVRPLGTAAFARRLECARLLLEAGADADGAGEGGFVPLHAAAQNGDEALVRLLLTHGATPTRPADDGTTPLDLARSAGHEECAGLLEAAAAPGEPPAGPRAGPSA